tara:strand:+ start:263 stop:709 length:447 start_codon:yes stop_codon:yes gene_type:complete
MIEPTESKCGDCTVCCEVMGYTGQWKFADRYNEAEKYGVDYGAFQTCNKLCDTGCSIQADKPRICDEFFCHYIKLDLEDGFRPDRFKFVSHVYDGSVTIISTDKTLPPDIQYNNNQERLNDLIDDVLIYEGKRMPVYLYTKQGIMRVR